MHIVIFFLAYRFMTNVHSYTLLLFLFICLAGKAQRNTDVASTSRPNIIFILTDDQRLDALGATGNTIIHTPNIDKIARKGILFSNAYVTTSICCVSRASILSGQYMLRHKIEDFATPFTDEALQQTYPLLLRKAGYTTGFIGKFGIGTKDPSPALFDYWACSKEMDHQYYLSNTKGEKVHNTDSISNAILQFLGQHGTQTPFCLSVSFKAPHELDGSPPTYPVQEKFKTLYVNDNIPEPLTADPAYWNNFPDFFRTDKNIARIRWKPLFSTPELYQQTVKNYYRMITGVDEAMGKMMEKLQQLGIAGNTVIVYMSDNGFSLGEHGLEGKWYPYEESVRVPLIIFDPRRAPAQNGKIARQMALNIDIAPTLLSLAGVATPGRMQGQDLFALTDNKIPERKDFFYKHTFAGTPALPQSEAVISKSMKYIIYTEHHYEELYDLSRDPYETTNLAGNGKYKKQMAYFRKRLETLKRNAL